MNRPPELSEDALTEAIVARMQQRNLSIRALAEGTALPYPTVRRHIERRSGWRLSEVLVIASYLDIRLSSLARKAEAA